MNPIERFYYAVMHREADKVPVCIITAAAEYAQFAGISIKEYYFDPKKELEA